MLGSKIEFAWKIEKIGFWSTTTQTFDSENLIRDFGSFQVSIIFELKDFNILLLLFLKVVWICFWSLHSEVKYNGSLEFSYGGEIEEKRIASTAMGLPYINIDNSGNNRQFFPLNWETDVSLHPDVFYLDHHKARSVQNWNFGVKTISFRSKYFKTFQIFFHSMKIWWNQYKGGFLAKKKHFLFIILKITCFHL